MDDSGRFDEHKRARARAVARRDFAIHLAIFLVSAVALVGLNLLDASGVWWSLWLILVWALGVALHGLSLTRPLARLARFFDASRYER